MILLLQNAPAFNNSAIMYSRNIFNCKKLYRIIIRSNQAGIIVAGMLPDWLMLRTAPAF